MNTRHGFTLVELLVASSMMVMLAAASFAAFSAGTRSAEKARRQGEMLAHGRAALEAMSADIRAAVAQDKSSMVALDVEYEGLNADTLDFIAAGRVKYATEEQDASGRCEIGYYIENDPDTEFKWLLRREDATLDDDFLEGGQVGVAGPYVAELNLEFYDGSFWQSEWIDQEDFPAAVYIQLVVVDEDEIESKMLFSTIVSVMGR